jgi:hypothetical protein
MYIVYFNLCTLLGCTVPEPKEDLAKYSGLRKNILLNMVNTQTLLAMPKGLSSSPLSSGAEKLLSASLAKSSWSKHVSGLNALASFEEETKIVVNWPISVETIRSFAVWCVEKRKLKSDTVKSYVYAISLAHSLQGLNCQDFSKDKILMMLLSGADNLNRLKASASSTRRVVTLHTLLVIGHRIACSNWTSSSKIVFWTLCTVAFFTSARLGELLCKAECFFDPTSDLLWKDVKFNDDHILVHVKNPKSKNKEGDFLDIFKFDCEKCCPFLAFNALKNFQITNGFFSPNMPVFRFINGKNLTQAVVNSTLKSILSDLYVPGINVISGHSFRGGIPSQLTEKNVFDGKTAAADWGRWRSDAVKTYCRLKTNQKNELFDIISDILNNK